MLTLVYSVCYLVAMPYNRIANHNNLIVFSEKRHNQRLKPRKTYYFSQICPIDKLVHDILDLLRG